MKMDRLLHCTLGRIAFIARKLREGEPINCTTVATHFEVCTKTAQRDFDFIRDRLGWELVYDQEERSFQLINAPTPVLL